MSIIPADKERCQAEMPTSSSPHLLHCQDSWYLEEEIRDKDKRIAELEAENERLKSMMGDVVDQILNHQVTGDEECPFCMSELVSKDEIREFKAMVRK